MTAPLPTNIVDAALEREIRRAEREFAGDEVTLLLGANPGEPALALSKVASGGELARAMLAARLVLSPAMRRLSDDPGPDTLVFDEVDAGIGGEAAAAVGEAAAGLAVAVELVAGVVAVEASAAALEVAKRNAVRLGLEVELRHGRWLEPLAGERFDLVVSNPPYVAAGDPHLADLRFEPASALVSGRDGLDAIRDIVRQAPAHLAEGGWLLLEHGMGQEGAVRELLAQAGLESVRTWPDLAGIPRVSGGRR